MAKKKALDDLEHGSAMSFKAGFSTQRPKINFYNLIFVLSGVALIMAYLYGVHPLDFARGYTEDWCQPDMTRQLMSEALVSQGGPSFHSSAYMAPDGMSMPFMSWGIEVSWLGAYFWKWSRDFPFFWMHFGLSLVASYLGVGYCLRKMKLGAAAAWGLALAVVLFHIPRHFKIWHHYEHVLQHWVYWSFFLDAWIWQRFWRERRWSWSLEAWRGLCLLGMLTTAGYFWGPLILECLLVRLCIAVTWGLRSKVLKQENKINIEGSWKQALPAIILGCFLAGVELRWFLPLSREAKAMGHVFQQLGWFERWQSMFRPLWLDGGASWPDLKPFSSFETLITPGWFFWIPVLTGLFSVQRSRRGFSSLLVALPFLILLEIAALYFSQDPPWVASQIRHLIPFMGFFRVTVRWGLFLPEILGVTIALCWPELRERIFNSFRLRPRWASVFALIFALSSVFELSQLTHPVSTMPKLSDSASRLLLGVKTAPGTTVLDLPFCLAGGNGVCATAQCPNYPEATTGGCFRGWHDKNVYGIYSGRLVPKQCETYNRAPYLSWFDAWRTQRCFSAGEWTDFCSYLKTHSELSAILLYPDIWQGAGDPQCLSEFRRHLGAPVDQAEFAVRAIRGKEVPQLSRLLRFEPRCIL